ncbi:DUF192 domain-containing protein [Sphingomonas sp.]|uniref:DUF192 domain-containing protein n=1 Tax=Sphingomonas sp. TaxID=28214 RepID=UPI002DD68900|nr:DUF192 domain-containing protein [Sphingomonas sp.]
MRIVPAAFVALGLVLASAGCKGGDAAATQGAQAGQVTVTIRTASAAHAFRVEVAKTAAEQQRGLMYRTDIAKDGGMLFAPYPPEGGPPREASFWMENTPTSLDIVYIRADGTIARIAENTVPFSRDPIPSGEPVAAVLEILGGRAAELGIGEGDKVEWPR